MKSQKNQHVANYSSVILKNLVLAFQHIRNKRCCHNITYQALDMLALRYVMYKMPVQRHSTLSSQMYHLNLQIETIKQFGSKLGKYIFQIYEIGNVGRRIPASIQIHFIRGMN